MGRFKTMKDQYLNDIVMKKFNTWANDIVNLLTHVVLFMIGMSLTQNKAMKIILWIYMISVLLSLFTPSEEK